MEAWNELPEGLKDYANHSLYYRKERRKERIAFQ